MKILQINSVYGIRSTGRIIKEIHKQATLEGWESFVIYGRVEQQFEKNVNFIGNKVQVVYEMGCTLLFGQHGYGSKLWTNKILKQIELIKPDVIHLHNIHGYYLNVDRIFEYLKKSETKVIWTLHDCWAYTGHCAYYSFVGCEKWKTVCHNCPALKSYPYSFLCDRSEKNYLEKKVLFNGLSNCTLVTPSKWLRNEVISSFLKNYPTEVIPNGVDLDIFRPIENIKKLGFTILAVANIWEERKGLKYCLELSNYLIDDERLVIIGLNDIQLKNLPNKVVGIKRTESINELVEWYNIADVFINPTLEDNFPTTNLEALACGTPVITFNTGGSVESVNDKTGLIVESNTEALYKGIIEIKKKGKLHYLDGCRSIALELYSIDKMKKSYMNLYRKMIKNA